ncbi:MAG: GAF domain-containing protein [Planctomycetaceae bacterium]|nr:GAF domain-containing protein [Planctomycetaceae bacterium]
MSRIRNKQSGGLSDVRDSEFLTELWRFREKLRSSRDIGKLIKSALKLARQHFSAAEGCLATVAPGEYLAEIEWSQPNSAEWDPDLLGGFLRGQKVKVPKDTMLARVRRRGRMWGVLVLRREDQDFFWDSRQDFSALADVVNEMIDAIEQERISEVRLQVDQKVLEQVKPKHLFYKLLHAIKSLTEYDHSATLMMCDDDGGAMEVVAEQVAFQKRKGENVGLSLPLDRETRKLLKSGQPFGFDRRDGSWDQWSGEDAGELVELLDYNPINATERFPAAEHSMICVPLVTKDGLIGALKVASIHAGTLREYETELLTQFLPQASVALQNLKRTESLENQVIAAERKYAMAELARGVAHDVNNALGAVLPLVQQMQTDLDEGFFDETETREDLQEIEKSLLVCKRIFNGMLHFARNETRNASDVSLPQVIDSALSIFKQNLERHKVHVTVTTPADLPMIEAVQADIEQLVLNLVGNARDAMEPDDELSIVASAEDRFVVLEVTDTGCGIPQEHLAKIQEPFFTTKADGNGLGLAICRSIVAQLRGQFKIESQLGEGTHVTVKLPYRNGVQ